MEQPNLGRRENGLIESYTKSAKMGKLDGAGQKFDSTNKNPEKSTRKLKKNV